MKRPAHITDEYVLAQAQDDIESANGHQGNPIEGDTKVTADFDNFDLSVEAYDWGLGALANRREAPRSTDR